MYYAGAADARYDIRGTGLPQPHAGCLLEKVSISGGKVIEGGVTFAVGVKDILPAIGTFLSSGGSPRNMSFYGTRRTKEAGLSTALAHCSI